MGNTICPKGWCSRWNWCGTSSLHKSTHQAAFDAKPACSAKKVVLKAKKVAKKVIKCNVSKNGRCGKPFHNTICAWGYCSRWNWWGTSALHKRTHQPAFDAKPACMKRAKKVVKKVVKKAVKKAKKIIKKATKAAKKIVKKAKKNQSNQSAMSQRM